jgi:hypothetical protein
MLTFIDCRLHSRKQVHDHEKSRPSKRHYLATKIQKTIHIQLLCKYLLGITTRVRLSPKNMMY